MVTESKYSILKYILILVLVNQNNASNVIFCASKFLYRVYLLQSQEKKVEICIGS